MDDHTISLVRESFDLIEPVAPQAGYSFCRQLAASDPALHLMLGPDLEGVGARLMQRLAEVVIHLDEPASLKVVLERLRQRLAGRDLSEPSIEAASRTMLLTLYEHLGVAYNEEVEIAWLEMFREVTAALRTGRRETSETAPA